MSLQETQKVSEAEIKFLFISSLRQYFETHKYLWQILGRWDIFYLHWFHELIQFNCYNISISKKEKLKDETSKNKS